MKLVKMTSQWKQWQHGHRVAMRFSTYTHEAQAYEEADVTLVLLSADLTNKS